MKILGLTCSTSGYECNWSTFEAIHTKKRNRLEQKNLNDLVFIQYNQKLRERFQTRKEKPGFFDPICLNELDADNKWLVETEDPVFCGEELTWALVEDVAYRSTPGEGSTTRRRRTRGSQRVSNSRQPVEEIEEGDGDNDDQAEDHPPLDVDEVLVRTDDKETEEEEVYVEEGDDSNDDDGGGGGGGPGGDMPQWLLDQCK
ncbi:uncharacterized protein LOC131248982 [Magnolia sinica]|uniref:uncharacterized protein LOC131248982 n=1 Tax=Magnolia sinica TaxID=86752 RepID=UPI002659468D|nr:uncharacterized protein LOC131248982 [Magnolia sinica]